MTDGERVQLGWRVSADVKRRFEQWASQHYGETPGWKGRAVESAMAAAMGDDPIDRVEEQLLRIADSLDVEKVRGKRPTLMADGFHEVPEGKNPGDVAARRRAVITHLVDLANDGHLPDDEYGPIFHTNVLERKIEEIANVHSPKTVKRYKEAITSEGPFQPHPDRTGFWLVKT